MGEEVDRADQERQERSHQDELDRPAADDAGAEVDVARRSLGELEAGVERSDQVLRRAAELRERLHVERVVVSGRRESLGRPFRQCRQGQGRNAARHERALLVEREREPEIEQLADGRVPGGFRARLLENAERRRSDEGRRGRTCSVAGDHQPRRLGARECIEADHGQRVLPVGRALGEVRCTESPERAAVGRDEDERVRRLRLHERRAADRREGAGELDQGARSGRVVVDARSLTDVVAVRGDDDRALRGAADDGDDISQLDLAAARDLRRELVHAWVEAVQLELISDPGGRAQAAGRSGRTIGILGRQVAGELLRDRDVEGRRQRRRRQRLWARDAEGGKEERQRDEEPGSAHEARVHGPLDRAAAGARAWRPRSSGRRHCTGQCREDRGRL